MMAQMYLAACTQIRQSVQLQIKDVSRKLFFLFLRKKAKQQIRRFFHPKNADIILISQQKHMFSSRNKKNIMWIPPLICSYEKGML